MCLSVVGKNVSALLCQCSMTQDIPFQSAGVYKKKSFFFTLPVCCKQGAFPSPLFVINDKCFSIFVHGNLMWALFHAFTLKNIFLPLLLEYIFCQLLLGTTREMEWKGTSFVSMVLEEGKRNRIMFPFFSYA